MTKSRMKSVLFIIGLMISYVLSLNALKTGTFLVLTALFFFGLSALIPDGRRKKEKLREYLPLSVCALVFCLVGAVGLSTDAGINSTGLPSWMALVPLVPIYYFLIIPALEQEEIQTLTRRVVIGLLSLEAALAILFFFAKIHLPHQFNLNSEEIGLYKWRMMGPNRNSSDIALKMFLLCGVLSVGKRTGWAYAAFAVALFITALAFNRTTMLTLSFLMAVYAVAGFLKRYNYPLRRIFIWSASLTGFALVAGVTFFVRSAQIARMPSLHARHYLMREAWNQFLSHPILGNANFRYYIKTGEGGSVLNHPHNFHLFALSSYGIFYYLAFMAVLLALLMRGANADPRTAIEKIGFFLIYVFVQNSMQLQMHYPAGFADLVLVLILVSSVRKSTGERMPNPSKSTSYGTQSVTLGT